MAGVSVFEKYTRNIIENKSGNKQVTFFHNGLRRGNKIFMVENIIYVSLT